MVPEGVSCIWSLMILSGNCFLNRGFLSSGGERTNNQQLQSAIQQFNPRLSQHVPRFRHFPLVLNRSNRSTPHDCFIRNSECIEHLGACLPSLDDAGTQDAPSSRVSPFRSSTGKERFVQIYICTQYMVTEEWSTALFH